MTRISRTVGNALAEHDNDYTFLEHRASFSANSPHATHLNLQLENSNPYPIRTTIVIPAWNAQDTILSCLTAIENSSFNRKYQQHLEVVVIDDGSTDNTWELLLASRFSLNLLLIRQEHNGQSRALNNGIAMSHGEIIVSCDADMILCDYAVEAMVRMYDFDKNLIVVGFRTEVDLSDPRVGSDYLRLHGAPPISIFFGDQRIAFHVLGYPDNMCVATNHFKRFGYMRGLWMPNDVQCKDPWLLTDMVFGAFFALPKETYERIGGYDERLLGWGCADSLVGAKAIANGNKVVPLYSASGFHVSHDSRTSNKWEEYVRNRRMFKQILSEEIVGEHPNYLHTPRTGILDLIERNPQGSPPDYIGAQHSNNKHLGEDVSKYSALFALGRYNDCLYEIASNRSEPYNVATRELEGRALLALERLAEAESIFTEIHHIEPNNARVLTYLATARAAEGQFRAAREALDRIGPSGNTNLDLVYWLSSTETHILRGDKYATQGFYDIAQRCYETALVVDPTNMAAISRREECLRNRGR